MQAEYLLGEDGAEIARLGRQHRAWLKPMHALLEDAGLRSGMRVLDLGCGPGFTTFELAHFVGASGEVLACDASQEFLDVLTRERDRRGLSQVKTLLAGVQELPLKDSGFDMIYGRWILSWVADVAGVIEKAAELLRPGGRLVLQEYLDWGASKLLPRSEAFDAGVLACMENWASAGGCINVSQSVVALAKEAGLGLESFLVQARSGRPGDLVWQWLGEFYHSFWPTLVERGHLTQGGMVAFLDAFDEAGRNPNSVILAPVMADIVLKRPS